VSSVQNPLIGSNLGFGHCAVFYLISILRDLRRGTPNWISMDLAIRRRWGCNRPARGVVTGHQFANLLQDPPDPSGFVPSSHFSPIEMAIGVDAIFRPDVLS